MQHKAKRCNAPECNAKHRTAIQSNAKDMVRAHKAVEATVWCPLAGIIFKGQSLFLNGLLRKSYYLKDDSPSEKSTTFVFNALPNNRLKEKAPQKKRRAGFFFRQPPKANLIKLV